MRTIWSFCTSSQFKATSKKKIIISPHGRLALTWRKGRVTFVQRALPELAQLTVRVTYAGKVSKDEGEPEEIQIGSV